jgi:hypothetical protein
MTPRDKSRFKAAEIRFLRSLVGITRRNRIRNDYIRKKLHLENSSDIVNKYREKGKNQVQHMTENIIPRQMLDYQLQGIKGRGRHSRRWHGQT